MDKKEDNSIDSQHLFQQCLTTSFSYLSMEV